MFNAHGSTSLPPTPDTTGTTTFLDWAHPLSPRECPAMSQWHQHDDTNIINDSSCLFVDGGMWLAASKPMKSSYTLHLQAGFVAHSQPTTNHTPSSSSSTSSTSSTSPAMVVILTDQSMESLCHQPDPSFSSKGALLHMTAYPMKADQPEWSFDSVDVSLIRHSGLGLLRNKGTTTTTGSHSSIHEFSAARTPGYYHRRDQNSDGFTNKYPVLNLTALPYDEVLRVREQALLDPGLRGAYLKALKHTYVHNFETAAHPWYLDLYFRQNSRVLEYHERAPISWPGFVSYIGKRSSGCHPIYSLLSAIHQAYHCFDLL